MYPLLSVYTFMVQVSQCVSWGLDVCCWCSFFLFIMYCPMAVASQCLSPEVLFRPGDCKVRAGSSFTLQLSPTAAAGGAGREPVAQSVGASPAQWRGAGATPYPFSHPAELLLWLVAHSGGPDFTLSHCYLLNFGMYWSSTLQGLVKLLVLETFSHVCAMIFDHVAFHLELPRL